MKKFIKRLILFILIGIIVILSLVVLNGYKMYQNAITQVSLEDKINEIMEDPNYIQIESLPEYYKNAVISVEDHRFKDHGGIDIFSIGRAIINNIKAFDLVEGGSTITQQVAKNMYFTQEKEFTRKVAEVFVAFNLEKNYSKDDILELYVNTSYFGDGYYGIKNACNGYLEKQPSDITLYEATLMAGIPNAPSIYAPTKNLNLAKKRQEKVIQTMVENGYLTQEEADNISEDKTND